MKTPNTTYRLQFNRDFRFVDALGIVDYLHSLGITDVYASPILKARAGSTHGYDVTDPTQLNPEIGTPEEFDALCTALQERGMGLVLDIVPNHMAASLENPWWFDVLEKGRSSPYAQFFDVNWDSEKVLLPILGKPYGEALENHELVIKIENDRPVLQYYEQKLPIAAGAENINFEAVDHVLERQHYRLAYWRKASDSINYRRFFDISDLVGLRTEQEEVFAATHKFVLELLRDGKVTGLRIDHIDGLLDPKGYLDRLPETYVVTEKILAGTEELPADWRCHGTTGYEFLNFANGPFVDPDGFHKLERIYTDFTGARQTYTEVFRENKRKVMKELFEGELNALVHRLSELAEDDRHARDLRSEELREAFIAVTATLPVYRTYVRGEQVSDSDRARIESTISEAGEGAAFDFLRRVLLVEPAWYIQQRKPDYLDFVMRWQQFTGPVMAKGLEDTTFYVHNPLVSVNEVGGDSNGPDVYFGVDEFHRRNLERQRQWPQTMNASSTHDTKRSEDTRARIDALSEFSEDWRRCLRRWARLNRTQHGPHPNEQVLIYESLLGAWPIEADRLKQYVTKALREGKTNTSWINVNEDYERHVLAFVDSLYTNERFLRRFRPLQEKVAYFGALNSLSQLVIKLTAPGVPDVYRGMEMWDFSLADPDNRRPVDFTSRPDILQTLQHGEPDHGALMKNWQDGRIKLYTTMQLLHCRRSHPELFLTGEYIPLQVTGARATHVIAFARRLGDQCCVVAVPRLCASLTDAGTPPLGKKVWKDTRIELPDGVAADGVDVFTKKAVNAAALPALFAALPFAAVLITAGRSE